MDLTRQGGFAADGEAASLALQPGYRLRVDVLEPWLLRIAVLPLGGLRQPRGWSIAPSGEPPYEGRDRLSRDGFSCPPLQIEEGGEIAGSATLRVRLLDEAAPVRAADCSVVPLALAVERRRPCSAWQTVLQDRPVAAWRRMAGRDELHHCQRLTPRTRHLGLGDKTGPLDRSGRRLRCLQLDALGYDAQTSDPLYKHVPWLIVDDAPPMSGGVARQTFTGLYYDTLSEISFDLGAEHSNYHPRYRSVESREDGMVLYVVDGPSLAEVVCRFSAITGGSALLPRRALGFGFTSMHHADAPDAQARMLDFVAEARKRDVPLSTLQMGSGYSRGHDGKRYVFEWNRDRFPDRDGFLAELRRRGLASVANVKPVLLTTHPAFAQLAADGAFVTGADGKPAIESFWDGLGASLDFTRPATRQWWRERIEQRLLEPGVSGIWNDNNECELFDEHARFDGDGIPMIGMDARPLQALLMVRVSVETMQARHPDARPYAITRAGPVGLARYAQTWTGDNRTSWHSLRWNLASALSMSLSAMPHVGHDIGGFSGASPEPELLARWVEMMVAHPRAVMNSWKQDSGIATTPWLHESVADAVRELLRLRYRLLPWLHHLNVHCHEHHEPLMRPLCWAFDDPACRDDVDSFLLGDDLLVAPVAERGAVTRDVHLPEVKGGWHHWNGGWPLRSRWYAGGRTVRVAAPPGTLAMFVRDGAVLPLALSWPADAPHDAHTVQLAVFLREVTANTSRILNFEDGWSYRIDDGDASRLQVVVEADDSGVRLQCKELASGRGRPVLSAHSYGTERPLEAVLPVGGA